MRDIDFTKSSAARRTLPSLWVATITPPAARRAARALSCSFRSGSVLELFLTFHISERRRNHLRGLMDCACNPNDAHLLAIRPAYVKNGVGPPPPLGSNAQVSVWVATITPPAACRAARALFCIAAM